MKIAIDIFCRPALFILLGMIFLCNSAAGQDAKIKEAQKIFYRIEEGLNNAAVDKFSNYFGDKNYLSLSNGTAGYYSSNQAYYVIKDFLSVYTGASFKLVNIVSEASTPFASGILKFNHRGIRGSANVFISLQSVDNQWRISQITIN